MSFQWAEYIGVAQDLLGQTCTAMPSTEAKQRAAASRAYYAAYWSARSWLERNGLWQRGNGEGSHEVVIRLFSQQPRREFKGVGMQLKRLRAMRTWADYEKPIGRAGIMGANTAPAAVLGFIAQVNQLDFNKYNIDLR